MAATSWPRSVDSAEDRPTLLQKWIFPIYLSFTVFFYSYRLLNGLGAAESIYDVDVPVFVRVSKDIVWILFALLAFSLSTWERWRVTWANVRRHAGFFLLLASLVGVFAVTGWIHLFLFQSLEDSLLYWYRYPLEYIPIVLLLPLVVSDWRQLGRLAVWLGWAAGAFLVYELASGVETGFVSRYGSLFGSPNDFGLFSAMMALGLFVCARKFSHWALAALMVFGLVVSLSRSAILGFIAGLCSLLYLGRVRRIAGVAVLVLTVVSAWAMWREPPDFNLAQVAFASEHMGLDESAMERLDELRIFEERFGRFKVTPFVVGTDYFHAESWYMALLIRTGVFGLGLWLAVMGATIVRGWRMRKRSSVYAVALAAVVTIGVASSFLPFPDVFPSNFYLWLAVGMTWFPESILHQQAMEHDQRN